MIDHPKCRPPPRVRLDVIAAFDQDTWGAADDGEQHHAFLCSDPVDDTSATAYVASCECAPSDRTCPRFKILQAGMVSFDSVSIIEVKPPSKRKRRK